MARLAELPKTFMEHFLARNPNAIADSNGYSRKDYEDELKRRIEEAKIPPPAPRDRNMDPAPWGV